MNFNIIQPSIILAPYIKNYWVLKGCIPKHENHFQRIVPNGFVELIFYYKDTPQYFRKNSNIKSTAIISGQQDEFYDIKVHGDLQLFSVVFLPQAARMFLGIPVSELYNQSIPAELIFKNDIDTITSKLSELNYISEKVNLIEDFLVRQITKNQDYKINRIANSVGDINSLKGINLIDSLASNACLSRKQFERTFAEFVGIAPKKFLRIVRFQYALYSQQIKSFENLTALAYDCGYYDQSHMINDFKKLTGLTPNQFFAECDPYSDYFSA